nr:unnamed protein product [Callosobruchus chinensis]
MDIFYVSVRPLDDAKGVSEDRYRKCVDGFMCDHLMMPKEYVRTGIANVLMALVKFLNPVICKKEKVCVCAKVPHGETPCIDPKKCVNCEGSHSALYKGCPKFREETAIQRVKTIERISYTEAQKKVKQTTPKPNISYASATTLAPPSTQTISHAALEVSIVPEIVKAIRETLNKFLPSTTFKTPEKPSTFHSRERSDSVSTNVSAVSDQRKRLRKDIIMECSRGQRIALMAINKQNESVPETINVEGDTSVLQTIDTNSMNCSEPSTEDEYLYQNAPIVLTTKNHQQVSQNPIDMPLFDIETIPVVLVAENNEIILDEALAESYLDSNSNAMITMEKTVTFNEIPKVNFTYFASIKSVSLTETHRQLRRLRQTHSDTSLVKSVGLAQARISSDKYRQTQTIETVSVALSAESTPFLEYQFLAIDSISYLAKTMTSFCSCLKWMQTWRIAIVKKNVIPDLRITKLVQRTHRKFHLIRGNEEMAVKRM